MIKIDIPGTKKSFNPLTLLSPPAKEDKDKTPHWRIAKHRDEVVRKLYKDCPYVVGDYCYPVEAEKSKYKSGVIIEHICKSYAEMGKDTKWDDDNPMIVCALHVESNTRFFCTVNYLQVGKIKHEC